MTSLTSTYRIQFHKDFKFEDLENLLEYFQQLGVGTIYASPIFTAVPGSNHGYDGLDAHEINPETGSYDQLKSIAGKLRAAGIKWLQDIVPNHMAFDPRNEWLADVLEKGPQSKYGRYFDAAWSDGFFNGRLMVPFLGDNPGALFENKELLVDYHDQRFVFKYYDTAYPLQPLSYEFILRSGKKIPAAIKQLLQQLPKQEDADSYAEAWQEFRMQLAGLMKNDKTRSYIEGCLKIVNTNKDFLQKIEEQQSYQLCHWQDTNNTINYRRFFTVNGLICLNMHDEKVFDEYHALVKTLVDEDMVHGLRIDHVDGLYDPSVYLQRLRELAGETVPVIVEKILEPGETLPNHWPIQGSTGYDFLSLVNNLLTCQNNERLFTRFYKKIAHDSPEVHEQVIQKKAGILEQYMQGELENLYQLLLQLNLVEKKTMASARQEDLKEVIAEFLIHCPVYRFYGNSFPLDDDEASSVKNILIQVRRYNPELKDAIDVFENVLLYQPDHMPEEYNEKLAHFYRRCMQFTGPLMAKGVEDTLMYTYNRFIAHNEVGDAPGAFGISIGQFHQAMMERQLKWPDSLNATSTHDTKRGEDVRARLNVLSGLGEEWLSKARQWDEISCAGKNENIPDENDRYFIFQTVVGAHPFPGQDEDNFQARLQEYLQKALREAKTNSDWTQPNETYEKAAKDFASALLDSNNKLIHEIREFVTNIADHSIINSLVQVVLKFTCPGIPDLYQGCELWDLSLVDPDNRRPVDYEKRMAWLNEISSVTGINDLWQERFNAKIKLWLTWQLMQCRRDQPYLFSKGDYISLNTTGVYKDHIIAFARKYRKNVWVVVLPLHTEVICREQAVDVLQIDWKDTGIDLPGELSTAWDHLVYSTKLEFNGSINVSGIFQGVPIAILKGQELANERGAGILLHISSLPSAFAIGDLGPEAKAFAGFLQRSSQKYWQVLPLNPTEEGQGHSPYSSISSRAGNVLFISPELMVKDGLLRTVDLQPFYYDHEGKTNYTEAERIRSVLFEKAWIQFSTNDHPLKNDFLAFEKKEKEWLDDFALYVLLKQENNGKPWFEWDEPYKLYDRSSLDRLADKNYDLLAKIKWLQFIFSRQWHGLRSYCNRMGIRLIGDLPFYVSYDSADVWAHRHLFAIDENGNRTGVAGVPPDAFSADGQLWGMPVFKWEEHKKENYSWWINRLKKNIELFDIVRLDHFRAFSAYWEVPPGETTARNGKWIPGPAEDLFETVQNSLGALPFIAEDLGEIDQPVYKLRDRFQLPGMKVLQFAFGNDMSKSVHIPHNYRENFIVYTGTHDNNTTRGWFSSEAGEETRLALERYIGRPISSAEVNIVLARLAYSSTARTVILPMQDVLNLDASARMNTPASLDNNWSWQLLPGQVNEIAETNLSGWVGMYNRD